MKQKKRQKIEGILRNRGWQRYFQKCLDEVNGDNYSNGDPVHAVHSLRSPNLFSSLSQNCKTHRPTLDLDVPAWLVPSATPGHSHLYIDVELTWRQYSRLLEALADCGILEQGFVDASYAKGGTFVRLPTVLKPQVKPRIEAVPPWAW